MLSAAVIGIAASLEESYPTCTTVGLHSYDQMVLVDDRMKTGGGEMSNRCPLPGLPSLSNVHFLRIPFCSGRIRPTGACSSIH
jgi:hypothetical protein